jgi:hypothetical protein
MKLWIFGQSMSTPHKVDTLEGWPSLLAKKLSTEYITFAQPGADNFYIYSTFLEQADNIADDDIVVIGWSHPNRKSFVLDRDNPGHQNVIDKSLVYKTPTREFIRSNNPIPGTQIKWSMLTPQTTNVNFYNTWFDNYYSRHEQDCNMQGYLDSTRLRCKGKYIPFYFSKESIANLHLQSDNVMLEFIIKNKVFISQDDLHLNQQGHTMWCDQLYNLIS